MGCSCKECTCEKVPFNCRIGAVRDAEGNAANSQYKPDPALASGVFGEPCSACANGDEAICNEVDCCYF